jgi:hypothetical protein
VCSGACVRACVRASMRACVQIFRPALFVDRSFFVARIVGQERHHILNATYVVRRSFGEGSVVDETPIRDEAHLRALLAEVFGLVFPPSVAGLDKYL